MPYTTSVNVSIEAPAESVIREISYDGREIYQPEFSSSDNLSKLIQMIDFNEIDGDTEQPPVMEPKVPFPDVPAYGWFDSVVSSLKKAATELEVMSDVLAITKQNDYLTLDPIPTDLVETKPMAQVYLRKKALVNASNIIFSAVNRLQSNLIEPIGNQTTPDFYKELLRLRQNWRLKRVSSAIIGDLSYKTAGSTFGQSGKFEVIKVLDNIQSTNEILSSAYHNVPIIKLSSTLKVSIPPELQGMSYIMVLCQKDQGNIFNTSFNLYGSAPANFNPNMHWQRKLEAAQNVLFCKELFNHLAKEAVQSQAPIPHLVTGNQISATVFPGIQLIISLCHGSTNVNHSSVLAYKANHDHVLEHSLHQLLREVHHRNAHQAFSHTVLRPLGPSKCRVVSGPNAPDCSELLQMSKSPTILEQIIEQAQHTFMRSHTEHVIDTLAKEVKDPLIISHWNSSNSPIQSCVKITIVSREYDYICRTTLLVHVMKKSLKCICRDGRVMNLSYEPQELKDLIFCQINQHQVKGVQAIANAKGWEFLASSSSLGLCSVEPMGNATSCLLASPLGDRLLSVKCEPHGNVSVSVAHSPKKDFFGGQLIKEKKWENLRGAFKKVQLDKMEGKNVMNKLELLMASLTSSTF